MLESVLTIGGSVIAGAVLALKVIAPRTKTVKDDKVLSFLEKVGKLLGVVQVTKAAPAPARPRVVDHR